MKIAFCPGNTVPFRADSLEERPLGGTETAIIRLSEALARRGHRVTILTQEDNPKLSEPLYLPLRAHADLGPLDVCICTRDWQTALLPIDSKKRFFWTGDAYDQPATLGLGDKRLVKRIDVLLAVSNWHARTLCAASGFPYAKARVLRNGVHLPLFEGTEARLRKRLIYSSTPYRGLALTRSIFPALRAKHPDTEFHVFSGFDVYAGGGLPEAAVREYQELAAHLRTMPGVVLHGNVKQSQLAREFMRSAVLLYPNTFAETSCITVMEAQAAGCIPVTSNLGALPETVGSGGVLISGKPGDVSYITEFISAVDHLLYDDAHFQRLSLVAHTQAQSYSWDIRAEELEHLILALF